MIKHRIVELGATRPRLTFIAIGVLTLLLAAMLPWIQVDTDPENMLSVTQSDRVFHNRVKAEFALHDAIVVGIVNKTDPNGVYNVNTLNNLHTLTDGILAIEGVIRQDLMSLATVDNIEQIDAGTISFQWMMKEAPQTAVQSLQIRGQVERLPLLVNTLVSGDGKAAAVYVPIQSKDESYRISKQIEALTLPLQRVNRDDEFYLTGLPVAEDTFGFEMFVQMGISAPLAMLVIFVLMWVFFRNIPLIVAPMIVAMVTVVITMGLLIGSGFTVHIMSSMIPIFLMPIAVVDSIHIMSEFADVWRPGMDRRQAIIDVVEELFTPMLFTSVTSAVGFLSLALTPIPPVQVFGVFVAIGIVLAFLLTIVFIPAYVVKLSPTALTSMQKAHHGGDTDSLLARGLRRMGGFALRRSSLLLVGLAMVLAISVVGITRIQINDNPVRWFKADHKIRIADKVLNEHFAGTYDAFYVLTQTSGAQALNQLVADFTNHDSPTVQIIARRLSEEGAPGIDSAIVALDDALWDAEGREAEVLTKAMRQLEQVQESLKYFLQPSALAIIEDIQQALMVSGYVGKTSAVTDLVKTVNRELRSGEPVDYRVPASSNGVAQALLQYQSSHRPQDLWRMVTPDYRQAVIWLQLKSGDNQDMSHVIQALDRQLQLAPLPDGVVGQWAGKTFINVVWQQAMVKGMIASLVGAFLIVLVMMVALFRSITFGLVAMLPLTITISFIYGLIGWVGKDYDMPIAVLSALTLGLSIDFAIHFLQRARTIYASKSSFTATMAEMFEEPGRAISRNAIVITIGFIPLLFAPLVPYITVGMFLAAIMAVSGLVTLLILPATASKVRVLMFGRVATNKDRSSA